MTLPNDFDNYINYYFQDYRDSKNNMIKAILTLFLIMYAGLIAPKLPSKMNKIFNNNFFRIIALFLIALLYNFSPTVSIVSAISIIFTIEIINRKSMEECINEKYNSLLSNNKTRNDDLDYDCKCNDLYKKILGIENNDNFFTKHKKSRYTNESNNEKYNEKYNQYNKKSYNMQNQLNEFNNDSSNEQFATFN